MDQQQAVDIRSKASVAWWSAAVVVCLVAAFIGLGMYAGRRAAALQRLRIAKLRAPSFVPVGLYPWLPQWAHAVHEVEGCSRDEWQALAAFPEVESVRFYQAKLTDTDLRQFRHMRRLVKLRLIGNPDITAAGLTHLEGLPRLAEVAVNGASVTDAGLRSLGTRPALRSLDLYGLDVTGTGIRDLSAVPQLRYLSIDAYHFPAVALKEFASLPSLEELRIYGWNVNNDSVRHLRLPPRLKRLDLRATGIFDDQPGDPVEGLAAVPGIERLEVLDLNGHFKQESTRRRLCERLGLIEAITPGVFGRAP